LAYGADAVYLGLPQFSLRAKTGFDFADLKAGIIYAHQLKKKVYVTVNVFAHEAHIELLPKFLKQLKDCRPDAIILSDPGILNLVKKQMPKIPIHLSTQANTLNSEAVKFWQKNGVKRIILGREASLKDIKKIHSATPKMELEVFVHGAMCLSYSGRCYLSAQMSGRSANLGLCTQPCRFEYKLYAEEKMRPGELMPIEEDGENMYIFNSKDLCLIDYLADLVDAGIVSFKIEGRTKGLYYVATVIRAYRRVLNKLKDKNVLADSKKELLKIDGRGYTTGFIKDINSISRQDLSTSKAKSDWQLVGQVLSQKNNLIEIFVHNSLSIGQLIELLTAEDCYKIKVTKILDKDGQEMTEIHGGTQKTYWLELSEKIKTENGLLRKKIN